MKERQPDYVIPGLLSDTTTSVRYTRTCHTLGNRCTPKTHELYTDHIDRLS